MLLRDSSSSGGVVLQHMLNIPAVEVMPLGMDTQPWASARMGASWPIYNAVLVFPKQPQVRSLQLCCTFTRSFRA